MDNGARKLLRGTVTEVRRTLAAEAGEAAAWRWAMGLGLAACMAARGVAGPAPDFFAAGGEPEPVAAGRCRELLAGCGELLTAPAALGWLHQFWHDAERAELAAASRSDGYAKVGAAAVVPATQVYSEGYMVDFLLANSLGALWLEGRPGSPLAAGWRYYVQPVAQVAGRRVAAADMTVCDPACGAGHFLLAAFDMLYDMRMAEEGGEPAAVAAAILNDSLYGADIDGRAVLAARAALWLRARERAPGLAAVPPGLAANLVAGGGELGSLAAGAAGPLAALLGRRYTVVAANPPYLDKRDYAKSLRDYLRAHYPAGAGNLYAAFVLRCLDLADRYVAMVTPQTFLFIRSYAALRGEVFGRAAVRTLAHLGLGAFSDAVVDAALFVLDKDGDAATPGVYFKLLDAADKGAALAAAVDGHNAGAAGPEVFVRPLAEATALPGRPLAYWLGDGLRAALASSPPLASVADVVLGMKTSDNARFVRRWWELADDEAAGGWAAYEKEASGYRYARPAAHLVRWTAAARDFYASHYSAQLPNPRYWFREGIVFGLISSKAFTAKLLPAGHMTDMAASCVFPHDEKDRAFFLGLLNSKVWQWLLKMFNPTVNYQPVDVQRLPLPDVATGEKAAIGRLAMAAAAAAGRLRATTLTDAGYVFDPAALLPLASGAGARLAGLWRDALRCMLAADAIDRRLAAAFRLSPAEAAAMAAELGASPGRVAKYDAATLAATKERLRERYAAGPGRGQLPEDFFAGLVADTGLHPISVCGLLHEGMAAEGWRCPPLERELTEDALSALSLAMLGHTWPGREPLAGPGLVPLAAAGRALDAFVGRWADPAAVRAEFAALTGVEVDRWLKADFFKRHVSQFRRRPIIWQVTDGAGGMWLVHRRRAGDLAGLLDLPDYAPRAEYGVRANIAPLQAAGKLAAPVLAAADLGKALADYERCVAGGYIL